MPLVPLHASNLYLKKPKTGFFFSPVYVRHQVIKRSLLINPHRIQFIIISHLQSCHPKNMWTINHFYCPEWASSAQWFSLVVTAAGLMMAAQIQTSAHALNWTIWAGTEEPCRIMLQGRTGSAGLSWYSMCPWTKPEERREVGRELHIHHVCLYAHDYIWEQS